MVTSLSQIKNIAAEKEEENIEFQYFLKTKDGVEVDAAVQQLNQTISPKIDCTTCGNCCKSLMINVTDEEANNLSNHLQQNRDFFDEQYLEKGTNLMVINTIPCHFLNENKCSVYEHRFAGCKEFPGLHLPNFTKRLFTIFMHYDRCPIIFNVVEGLKEEFMDWNK
jgi:uncharacterized protein